MRILREVIGIYLTLPCEVSPKAPHLLFAENQKLFRFSRLHPLRCQTPQRSRSRQHPMTDIHTLHGAPSTSAIRVRRSLPRPVQPVPGSPLPGVPEFVPARGLGSANLQTVCASFFPGNTQIEGTLQRHLRLDDGDLLVLHDDTPRGWERGDHVVLLLHGLGGSHRSGYMVRIARKLSQLGIRTFRLDHRGCGAGASLARRPYHAGRIDDIAAAVSMLERLCPGSPISIAGFSISGNMLLRYLGEYSESLPFSLFRAVAVCPPVDLHHCASRLAQSISGQRYDWYFTRKLISQIASSPQWDDSLPIAHTRRAPGRLYDFDELYTAPASGFVSADDYYAAASAAPVASRIRVHTTILASQDDPVVCSEPLTQLSLPANVRLCLTRHGGHLGFISRPGIDPDRRWMDWRVIEWLLE